MAAAAVGDWRPMPVARGSSAGGDPIATLFGEEAPGFAESGPGPSESAGASDPLAGTLTQLFDTYIVYQAAEGVLFVDQHSAHERVLYEGVMRAFAGSGAPAQRLLLPATIELTDEELDAVEQH